MNKRELLLAQDDCAPDSLEYFIKEMQEKFGLSIKDFKEDGEEDLVNEILQEWRLGEYVLSFSGDDPYYRLERTIRESILFQCAKCEHVYDPGKKKKCLQCGHEKTETRMIG